MNNIIDVLKERGFIDALTSEEVRDRANSPMKVYAGFDPTADSLHLGNFVGIMALAWFQKCGHTPFVILGGATGRIGDPSGKSVERPLLDIAAIRSNVERIGKHFEKILDFSGALAKPVILNNDSWFSDIYFIDFLRDIGKHFRISTMIAKESVKARLASEEGISFTEFSYQILQGYDFYHLFNIHDVSLQMGGSDQWGNITAGIELVRKLTGKSAYGLTFPLLTRSDGKKFGKSEEGAIWLAPDRCSPYQFYQYLVRIADADVIKLMRMLTFMDMKEIREYEEQMGSNSYIPNTAQRRLAEEVTRIVHGQEGLESALRVTEGASPGAKTSLDPETLQEIAKEMPHVDVKSEEILDHKLVDVIAKLDLMSSKGEAVRLIQNGGMYLNNERIEDIQCRFLKENVIDGKYLLLALGKKKKILLVIKSL